MSDKLSTRMLDTCIELQSERIKTVNKVLVKAGVKAEIIDITSECKSKWVGIEIQFKCLGDERKFSMVWSNRKYLL